MFFQANFERAITDFSVF